MKQKKIILLVTFVLLLAVIMLLRVRTQSYEGSIPVKDSPSVTAAVSQKPTAAPGADKKETEAAKKTGSGELPEDVLASESLKPQTAPHTGSQQTPSGGVEPTPNATTVPIPEPTQAQSSSENIELPEDIFD